MLLHVRGRHALALTVAALAMLAGCSGGTTVVPPPPVVIPTPAPTPTAVPIPQASAFAVTQQQTVAVPSGGAGATPVPVALPSAAGFVPTVHLPPASVATNAVVTATVQNTAPSGVPVLDGKRAALAIRGARAALNAVPILFVGLYWSTTLELTATPGFTFALPPEYIVAGAAYYLALYDPTRPSLGWNYAFEGPGTVAGGVVTFAGNPAPFTFVGGLNYWLALLAIPETGPSPTPAPSVTPTSVPTQSPPPTASPTASPGAAGGSITIVIPTPAPIACSPSPLSVAVHASALLYCAAPDYGGAFTTQIADPTIASVQQFNPHVNTYFTVTGLKAGSTTLSLRGDTGGTGSVTITVTP